MNNRLMKKEALVDMLNGARVVLKPEVIDYLESIINLEFSVVKDNISDDARRVLTELQVYRSALIYNIYKRDIEYFDNEYKKNNFNFFRFSINSNDVPSIKLFVKINDGNFILDNDLNKQIELTKIYFDRLQKDYDLKDNALTSGKKFVKKIPGLIIKKEFQIIGKEKKEI